MFARKSFQTGLITTFLAGTASAAGIFFEPLSVEFNNPIGIDYHEPTNSLVMSVNYSTGAPYNFERIELNGANVQFSAFMGATEEVKIATVQSIGNPGGFTVGDLFTGNGVDGQIMKITNDGATVISPWVDLPGDNNGLMRGSLYIDRTGVFGGDLIAVTTQGEVWRVTSAGVPTKLVDVNVHLEGVITVPNDVATYGPLAGKIIAGAEALGLLYAIDAEGMVSTYELGVNVEDIDLIVANQNFYGVNFGTSQLLTADASHFADFVGDILLTQEFGGASGLFALSWNGASLVTEAFVPLGGSFIPGQWEHVTFAPIQIRVPEPAMALLFGIGLLSIAWAGVRRT